MEVAKIPTAEYTRDAKAYVSEATQALRPYVGSDLGDSRIDPVLADVDSRYFDGARFNSAANGAIAFDNLQHLESFLKSRMTGASPPNGEAEKAHVTALVETLTGVRLMGDAAIQDAEATIGPFRASPPPAPAPAGLAEAFADLEAAKVNLAKADEMLLKANVEPATIQASRAWASGFNVLTRLGITYEGDKDNDGVVDVVELRFGSSPLLVDSDSDGLTDKFEITQLAGWTRPNAVDSDEDGIADGAEDVDNDGLTNLQEQDLGTSPTNPDTDGDGVNDGTEVAQGSNPLVADQPRAPPLPGDLPPFVPAPNTSDVDGDGLSDVAEEELLSDLHNVDSDGDGLSDGQEVNEIGTNPLGQDSDGDGLRDDYEVAHAEDQGLDPTIRDEQISKWTYVSDFLLGMFAGDFAPRDSMAWIAGNLCSGALSFIPVVGWILGGAADIRDTIAGLIHGDWVGAGLSILGVIPYVGDAVSIPAKAARFVSRFAHRTQQVMVLVATYDMVPDEVKEAAAELILGDDWTVLRDAAEETARTADGGVGILAARPSMLRLLKGSRNNMARLRAAFQHPLHVRAQANGWPARVRYQFNGPMGENTIFDMLAGFPGVRHQHLHMRTPDVPAPPSSARKPDVAVEDPPGELTLHEVKTGVPDYGHEVTECKKDAWMMSQQNGVEVVSNGQVQRYRVRGVHWHFMPHHAYNALGPTQAVLDCLIENGIPFTIHLPE
ncbi:hypothetical protein [Asanoa iriomotensis]|uniref:hypothetical protein n=1 Tax=Asanoa iriomotensis TaxID=234613 RepID=UPI0019438FB5|nr:hypothetical protein [Asanoa iriomotensis]